MSKPIKKCQICHKEFEQSFHTDFLDYLYNHKQTLIELEALAPYAPKELHQEIALVQQELGALDGRIKPIEKQWAVLLEDFFQKKLNQSFIELLISYLEGKNEPTICKPCGQEVEQQEKLMLKKLAEVEKDTEELMKKYLRVSSEIKKNIETEKFDQIWSKSDEKLKKAVLAELKALLEKPSESIQQDSNPQPNQPKPTNYTPWIIGGLLGAGLIIGVAIWLVLKNQRKNAKN